MQSCKVSDLNQSCSPGKSSDLFQTCNNALIKVCFYTSYYILYSSHGWWKLLKSGCAIYIFVSISVNFLTNFQNSFFPWKLMKIAILLKGGWVILHPALPPPLILHLYIVCTSFNEFPQALFCHSSSIHFCSSSIALDAIIQKIGHNLPYSP